MQLASFQKTFKIAGLVVLLLLVLAGVIFAGQRAATYLAKAGQCPAQKVTAAQLTANSAVISWETTDITQGKVDYGTTSTNLSFTSPEATSGKTHNVPLTLLTPNTVYYYLITIGNTKCDSSGQSCKEGSCVPWSFSTSSVTPQQQIVATLSPVATLTPTRSATPSATPIATTSATPTSSLSSFCRQVQLNIGASSQDATKWATLKQYDIDNNTVVNGLDVIKCQQAGK